MPRKSRQLRLSQAQQLSTKWAASPHSNDWRHRFINDMISRLERDRGTSTKQRNWLDSLIEEGVPASENKNPELTTRLDAAVSILETAGDAYGWEVGVLKDMRGRVVLGKQMSEKQASLLTRLIAEGERLASEGFWAPNEEELKDLKHAVNLYNGYASMWQNDRPAVARAVSEVRDHMVHGTVLKASSAHKLLKAVSGKLKKLKSPRFKAGDVGKTTSKGEWDPMTHRFARGQSVRVVCMSDVYTTIRGDIVNDWLLPTGELKTMPAERVAKR